MPRVGSGEPARGRPFSVKKFFPRFPLSATHRFGRRTGLAPAQERGQLVRQNDPARPPAEGRCGVDRGQFTGAYPGVHLVDADAQLAGQLSRGQTAVNFHAMAPPAPPTGQPTPEAALVRSGRARADAADAAAGAARAPARQAGAESSAGRATVLTGRSPCWGHATARVPTSNPRARGFSVGMACQLWTSGKNPRVSRQGLAR